MQHLPTVNLEFPLEAVSKFKCAMDNRYKMPVDPNLFAQGVNTKEPN